MVINIGALKSGQNELVESDIKAGANRIGTSAGVAIMEGESVDGGY